MARRRIAVTSCGLVQVVCLNWTKASRGGEGARARAAVPSAFEMATADLTGVEGMLVVGSARWGEHSTFAEPYSVTRRLVPLADGYSFGCVTVSADDEGLRVCYRYDEAHAGAPNRRSIDPVGHYESFGRTLRIRDGEWVRVCYNGRFSDSDTGNWWYQQVTVNVAWFAGEPDGRVFLDRAPAGDLRDLADLW